MRSWKTTLAGMILGGLPILYEAYEHLSMSQPVDWKLVWLGVSLGVMGALAKDWNVSGGDKK